MKPQTLYKVGEPPRWKNAAAVKSTSHRRSCGSRFWAARWGLFPFHSGFHSPGGWKAPENGFFSACD